MKQARPHEQLFLPIKRVWFDLIIRGKKKTEYREAKEHWTHRIMNPATGRQHSFKEIVFQVGYRKDAPWARVKAGSIRKRHSISCKPRNGEELPPAMYYCIALGAVLEVRGVPQERQMELFDIRGGQF